MTMYRLPEPLEKLADSNLEINVCGEYTGDIELLFVTDNTALNNHYLLCLNRKTNFRLRFTSVEYTYSAEMEVGPNLVARVELSEGTTYEFFLSDDFLRHRLGVAGVHLDTFLARKRELKTKNFKQKS